MVHVHWPLGDGMQRKVVSLRGVLLQGSIPDRQRIKITLDPQARRFRGRDTAVSARGETETLQRLRIQLKYNRPGRRNEAHCEGEFQIGDIRHFEVALFWR